MLYMGLPLAAVVGLWVADTRALRLYRSPVEGALTCYDVELKARYILHAALWGHPFEKRGHLSSRIKDVEEGAAATAYASAHSDDNLDDSEETMELAHQLLKPEHLVEAESVFRKGCEAFAKSAFLQLFVARFYRFFARNKHLHMRFVYIMTLACRTESFFHCITFNCSYLIRALRLHPSFDVDFMIFQARQAVEASSSGGSGMNALARIAFEKRLSYARKKVLGAVKAQAEFWSLIQAPKPDFDALHRNFKIIYSHISDSERALRELLSVNGSSIVVLRMVSTFDVGRGDG